MMTQGAETSTSTRSFSSESERTLPLHQGVLYGPVRSRRLGISLGINILPPRLKACSFNCVYCQYGWTPLGWRAAGANDPAWPSPSHIVATVAGYLRGVVQQGQRIDRLTLAGHGEPTLHPRFEEVVAELCVARDRIAPGLPIAILSNSSTLDDASVRTGLARLDERYMKLDTADALMLRRLNATRLAPDHIVEGLRSLPDVVIQAMFVRDASGRMDNSGMLAMGGWLEALGRIRPRAVHIYTLDRAPAWPFLRPVPPQRLRAIARHVEAAGIPAIAFV